MLTPDYYRRHFDARGIPDALAADVVEPWMLDAKFDIRKIRNPPQADEPSAASRVHRVLGLPDA